MVKKKLLTAALAAVMTMAYIPATTGMAAPALMGASQSAVSEKGLPASVRMNLDRELEDMIGETGTKVPGLGVIIFKDGKEVYSRFLGDAVIDSENPENNAAFQRDTRFRAASVSKQFTVFTIMQLAEEGKLSLDDDISKYLGFTLRNPAYPDTPLTVRMLASHTSSLRDGKVYSIPPKVSVKEFFTPEGAYYENGDHFAPAGEEPGAYFNYSNLNYGLLGTIIEKVTGERFDKYQKKHILKELDIQGDYVPGNFSRKEFGKLGTVYQKKNEAGEWDELGKWYGKADDYKGIQPLKDTIYLQNPYAEDIQGTYSLKGYKPGTNATMFSPQGGLRMSVEELSHALIMLMNDGVYQGKSVLSGDSVAEMTDKVWVHDEAVSNGSTYGGTLLSYGMGLYQIDGKSSARVAKDIEVDLTGHTGEAFGLLSGMFFRPGTKDGFVYIMNGEAVEEDEDDRSAGVFSGNYIWEENIMNAICEALYK